MSLLFLCCRLWEGSRCRGRCEYPKINNKSLKPNRIVFPGYVITLNLKPCNPDWADWGGMGRIKKIKKKSMSNWQNENVNGTDTHFGLLFHLFESYISTFLSAFARISFRRRWYVVDSLKYDDISTWDSFVHSVRPYLFSRCCFPRCFLNIGDSYLSIVVS